MTKYEKNINTKTRKSKEKKNKNKKLLKKIINNSESELDDIILDNVDTIAEENIQILIGGAAPIVEPSKFDQVIFGYNKPVDTEGPVDKILNNVKEVVNEVEEVAETAISVGKGIALKTATDMAGYEGKTPEEIKKEIKEDAQQIKEINNYFKTEDGKESLEEIKKTLNTATEVIGDSVGELPKQLNESMEELGKAGVEVGVGLATEIPGVNNFIGLSSMVKGTQNAIEATANAVKKVADITAHTAEDIKKPINEIQNEISEISDKVDKVTNMKQTINDKMNEEMPKLNDNFMQVDEKTNMGQIINSKMDEEMSNNNSEDNSMQVGGRLNIFQYGGKKLRKRINATRHAFKNVSKNVTLKRK
jgi:hypothetical protein